MGRRIFVGLVVVVFALAGLGLLTGCAKKELRTDMPAPEVKKKAEPTGPSEAELREQRLKEELARKRMMFLNEMVHFDFDKSDIRPDAAEVLKRKAAWLKDNPGVNVIIEGHCDERGTDAYNLALGERRAQAAKSFLVAIGIAEDRLETISYGEERPLDPGHNEEAWAKNRRAQFVIK
ncbi:MAG: peptidoglycan-associated lipoprotein Pal [Deltaproteobacteria bacterium]|nr:peptidoglycan-associated lipoprotein Pal [Deltaproteobacteria bacterium]